MNDVIENKISIIRYRIYNLLENNNLIEIKGLNFINDEQKKKDYIDFILLTLYKDLDHFQTQRYTYKQFMTNKPITKKEISKLIKQMEYIESNLLHYMPAIVLNTERQENQMLSNVAHKVKQELDIYLNKTKEIIQHFNNYENVLNSKKHTHFCNFYTREIDQEYVIRNLILRYLSLITQICFGENCKNKHKLFYDLLVQITGQEWDNFIPEEVKNIVKNISITKDIDKLKICFDSVHLSLPITDNTNKEVFNKLVNGIDIYNNETTKYYERFIFHNQFFKSYVLFKEKIGLAFLDR
ncbi:MAG: hypothetical protein KFW21_04710 [Spirochaetota bacterium]|nr:hypothetical protein [Spirochaetota bacterium]